MLTDPIADFITRMRNALMAGADSFACPSSRQKVALCEVLKKEKIIKRFHEKRDSNKAVLKVFLNTEKIRHRKLVRRSKPGSRVYIKSKQIPVLTAKSVLSVISTNQGVMTAKQARQKGLGGEWLVEIF